MDDEHKLALFLITIIKIVTFGLLFATTVNQARSINGDQCILKYTGLYVRHRLEVNQITNIECKRYYIFSDDYVLEDNSNKTMDSETEIVFKSIMSIDLYRDEVSTNVAVVVSVPSIYRNIAITLGSFTVIWVIISITTIIMLCVTSKSLEYLPLVNILEFVFCFIPIIFCQILVIIVNSKDDSKTTIASLSFSFIWSVSKILYFVTLGK